MNGVPVLMYHALEDEAHPAGAKDAGEQLYVLPVRQFREQMEYLNREGFRTFLLEELFEMDDWPEKAVVITFDDGHESNFTLALPILQEYGFKAEFFITTDWIGTPYFMQPDHIRELYLAGMGIGSHGVTHDFIDDMTDDEIVRELKDSMDTLTRIIGEGVSCFSAPGGRTRAYLGELAKVLGYLAVCTSEPQFMVHEHSQYSIPRFAIKQSVNHAEYSAMTKINSVYTRKLEKRNRVLVIAKKLLGNKGYQKVRGLILGK